MAASAFATSTAAALSSFLPDNTPKSAQQSPRNTANQSTVAVRAGIVEVPKTFQDGEKFIKWDEVSRMLLTKISVYCFRFVKLSRILMRYCTELKFFQECLEKIVKRF